MITSTVYGAQATRKPQGAIFNDQPNRGNRKEIELDDIELSVFANPGDTDRDFWSTREIVEHLAAFHLPTATGRPGSIPWKASDLSACPDWDKPKLATDDRSVAQCLNELLQPSRLLGWRVEPVVDSSVTPPKVTAVEIVPFTIAAEPVSLPSIGSLPATPDVIEITTSGDPLTHLKNKSLDSLNAVEQVIVRGPREIGIGTLSVYNPFADSGELNAWWSNRFEYEIGGDTDPSFDDLDQWDQRERNDRVRQSEEFRRVFRFFPLRSTWDGTQDGSPWFYEVDGEPYSPFLGSIEVLGELPIFAECDYTGAADEVDESDGRKMRPALLLLEKPGEPGFYFDAARSTNLSTGVNGFDAGPLPLSVRLKPENDIEPGISLEIAGAPAHALAADFSGNAADPDQAEAFGGLDYQFMRATVAIKADRRASFTYPNKVEPEPDVIRRKVISLDHPSLQLVTVAAGTIIGLEPDGTPIASGGGTLRDPSSLLEALARLAAERGLQPKHSTVIETGRQLGGFKPGAMIKTLNGERIDAPIGEISIRAETVEDSGDLSISQTIKASTAAVDILSLMGAQ